MVSIIMPSFNSSRFISQSIESILAQTYQDWELLIVDDFSVDNTVELIEQYARSDGRINLIKLQQNSGAAVARNVAIKASQGRYIAFLDSDDVWLPNKLEKQLAFMQETGCVFSYTAYDKIDEIGNVMSHIGVPVKLNYSDLLKTNSIGCLTAVYDTDYFGKVMMPLIRKRQDFGLWLKLLKRVDFTYGMNETLGQYRVQRNSISANKANTATYTWRLYRDVEKLSLLKAGYYFMQYVVRGVLRQKFPDFARKIGVLK